MGACCPPLGHDGRMARDWARLAAAIKAARARRGMRQVDLAEAAGVSEATVQNLESSEVGEERSRVPTSLAAVERALGWTPGSGEIVLAGGEPVPIEGAPTKGALAEGMPLRVQKELTSGKVVDTYVADLSRPGARGRFVVVWKADEADGAGELDEEDVAEWTRIQRAMRGLPTGEAPDKP